MALINGNEQFLTVKLAVDEVVIGFVNLEFLIDTVPALAVEAVIETPLKVSQLSNLISPGDELSNIAELASVMINLVFKQIREDEAELVNDKAVLLDTITSQSSNTKLHVFDPDTSQTKSLFVERRHPNIEDVPPSVIVIFPVMFTLAGQ